MQPIRFFFAVAATVFSAFEHYLEGANRPGQNLIAYLAVKLRRNALRRCSDRAARTISQSLAST